MGRCGHGPIVGVAVVEFVREDFANDRGQHARIVHHGVARSELEQRIMFVNRLTEAGGPFPDLVQSLRVRSQWVSSKRTMMASPESATSTTSW